MTSNAKIVLRKKPNKEGLYPLAVRITKNRRSNYHYIGHYINLKDWDEKNIRVRKSHLNADSLNGLLTTKLSEANKMLIDLQSGKKDISANQIKQKLYASSESITFFEVAKDFLDELEANKKLSRLSTDKARVNHVLNFSKSKQLTFQEIDEQFLRKFKIYLRKKHSLSERSIVNNLIVIRTIYNRAIKLDIVDRKLYPFGSDKIRIKFPETEKIGLTRNEVIKLESVKNLNENETHARNVWLFSFYFAGIRVADVLKIRWSDIYDERLHYRMNKNSKLLSLKIPGKIFPILEYYQDNKQNDDDFIFPEMKKANLKDAKDVYAKTKTANKKFNKYLLSVAEQAEISKKVTMHIARHTFGNISEDKIPINMLQKLYRHSSITTTINYQSNFMHKDTDEALDSVINF
ncbi:tyrosine-type recombinase/integrase [Salinimicrobium sp. CDJ15-81-2]|uniref:Site-specific integrase n=2 Tax=Flavobacteriaceae TaxID=49546 RepID=A0ABU3CL47_9FLAO|nr:MULTISPECIES: site-specific integrase [Flavobacteriaceae]MCZ2845640.1 site-specific integrase [Candidatus Bathyarchaeota archaeon]MDT0647073.1 site-specific integrase [Zunongwangia sp. F260]NJW52152.1 tyrosine-type recombinase/integrase [Salinimicrobium oceani]NJY63523.1 tyrosine-type recombinase/integrase [Salinimicrobium nanhaiense]